MNELPRRPPEDWHRELATKAAAKNRLRLRARTAASLMTAGVVIAMLFTDGWMAWALWGLALAIFAAPYALGWR